MLCCKWTLRVRKKLFDVIWLELVGHRIHSSFEVQEESGKCFLAWILFNLSFLISWFLNSKYLCILEVLPRISGTGGVNVLVGNGRNLEKVQCEFIIKNILNLLRDTKRITIESFIFKKAIHLVSSVSHSADSAFKTLSRMKII